MQFSNSDEQIKSIDDEQKHDPDHKYMVDVVKLLLGDEIKNFDEKTIENEMAEVLKFTRDLGKVKI